MRDTSAAGDCNCANPVTVDELGVGRHGSDAMMLLRRVLGQGFRRRFAFEGCTPVCFLKSEEVVKNVWVRARRETSVCKRLKMRWLLGRRFECARAFGRLRAGREEDRGVGTEGLRRSLPER